jgi:hypothetical protein
LVVLACDHRTKVPPAPAKISSSQSHVANKDAPPCLIVWRFPGYPGEIVKQLSGPELVAWDDGTVLIAANRDRPGERILIGRVDPPHLRTILSRIRDTGFFKNLGNYISVDASFTRIVVHDGSERGSIALTESLLPGMTGGPKSGSKDRSFVQMWNQTRGAIDTLTPIEIKPLENEVGPNGTFRGFSPSNKTPPNWPGLIQ